MSTLVRNDFSFVNVTDVSEDPKYMTIFSFEKNDYVPMYRWMTSNMFPLFTIGPIYLLVILRIQQWMKDREPFELRKPLFWWNLTLAFLSLVMFLRFLPEMVFINKEYGFYRSYCKRDHFNVATLFWTSVYLISKILEFADTLFIVLRKQKLTFLHTFHHASVYVACVFGMVRVDPAARYFALMNTFVHSVMYTYYALRSVQIKLPRVVAMAVTSVQLIQFATAIVINCLVVYAKLTGLEPHCERPNDITVYYFGLSVVYFYLFGNFFVETYIKKPALSKDKSL